MSSRSPRERQAPAWLRLFSFFRSSDEPWRKSQVALAVVFLVAQQAAPRTVTVDPRGSDATFEVSDHRIGDLDLDGRAEFVVLARDGRVRSFRPLSSEPARALGELVLAAPERVLLDLGRWGEKTYLIAETPQGTLAYPLDAQGLIGPTGATWIPRAKLGLRVGAPTFSRIVQDVNRDGVEDIVVPTLAGVELWQATLEPEKTVPSFRKAATVAVEIARAAQHEFETLSDALEHSLTIPSLDTEDVNGDGRPDLIVAQDDRRAWHLQRADASFPAEADVAIDLTIFRDTTPAAENSFGSTLAIDDGASFASRDLDGDSVPDYVIAHRRKVWVFRGGPAGPQFTEPSAILKTAEDVTLLLVYPLDDDALPDLLLIKVQVPTVAALLRGLFGEWDVPIRALGYKNVGAGKFETTPGQTSELSLRLPGIVGILKNPEKFTQRFEELEKSFRAGARGDVDGDGNDDILLVTADGKAIELWLGRTDEAPEKSKERWLRELLFGDPDRVWDIERAFTALGNIAARQVALATGDRPPDRTLPLRDPAETRVLGLECADFDGDGAREVVITCRDLADPRRRWFDVLVVAQKK